MRKKLYELHSNLFRPSPFAAWAKPKKADLNIARTKHLDNNNEVIWQIKKDGVNTANHIEIQVSVPHRVRTKISQKRNIRKIEKRHR